MEFPFRLTEQLTARREATFSWIPKRSLIIIGHKNPLLFGRAASLLEKALLASCPKGFAPWDECGKFRYFSVSQ